MTDETIHRAACVNCLHYRASEPLSPVPGWCMCNPQWVQVGPDHRCGQWVPWVVDTDALEADDAEANSVTVSDR